MPITLFREFIKLESASGIILIVAALLALIIANSPWQPFYLLLFNYSLPIALGHMKFHVSFNHIINDGLMTLFFLLVSLEVKRELIIGELNSRIKATLPLIAAIGGMLVPALIYILFNHHDDIKLQGWAIPTATDIAFSLAILKLLGSRIPPALKTFLMALAIIDDLGAIIIIALFYTAQLSIIFLMLAFLCLLCLLIFNYFNITLFLFYGIVGIILWLCIIKSGVHATIAGVILGFTIPLRVKREGFRESPLKKIERHLHPWVAYGILPLFAFANAGILFTHINFSILFNPLTLGIVLGLFLGKQIGIYSACWLAIKIKWAALPEKINWRQLYGVSLLCGIGFTMSLFIGTLAFFDGETGQMSLVRLGVLMGSVLSAIAGYCILRFSKT